MLDGHSIATCLTNTTLIPFCSKHLDYKKVNAVAMKSKWSTDTIVKYEAERQHGKSGPWTGTAHSTLLDPRFLRLGPWIRHQAVGACITDRRYHIGLPFPNKRLYFKYPLVGAPIYEGSDSPPASHAPESVGAKTGPTASSMAVSGDPAKCNFHQWKRRVLAPGSSHTDYSYVSYMEQSRRGDWVGLGFCADVGG